MNETKRGRQREPERVGTRERDTERQRVCNKERDRETEREIQMVIKGEGEIKIDRQKQTATDRARKRHGQKERGTNR